jgi:hypothetical protein
LILNTHNLLLWQLTDLKINIYADLYADFDKSLISWIHFTLSKRITFGEVKLEYIANGLLMILHTKSNGVENESDRLIVYYAVAKLFFDDTENGSGKTPNEKIVSHFDRQTSNFMRQLADYTPTNEILQPNGKDCINALNNAEIEKVKQAAQKWLNDHPTTGGNTTQT